MTSQQLDDLIREQPIQCIRYMELIDKLRKRMLIREERTEAMRAVFRFRESNRIPHTDPKMHEEFEKKVQTFVISKARVLKRYERLKSYHSLARESKGNYVA